MRRNTILLLLVLGGAGAVGLLLFLQTSRPERVRTSAVDPEAGPGGGTQGGTSRPPGATVIRVGPEARDMSRDRVKVPGGQLTAREPYDSAETLAAREEYAGRIVELLEEMLDPKLRFDEKRARSMELQRLLRLMGHRVTPDVRQRLLEMLTSVDPQHSMLVGEAIGSLEGDVETAVALVNMLKADPGNIRVSHAIYGALGNMDVKEVTPALLEMLGEGRDDEHLIVRTIGSLAGPEEVDALYARLGQPLQDRTRTEIELVLTQKSAIPGLLDKVAADLDEADPTRRRSLLKVLSTSRDPAHAQKVRAILVNETDSESRRIAIQALGSFGDAESGKVLLQLVNSGSAMEQRRAIQAIHTIRTPETISLLAKEWEGLDPAGRLAVIGAAARIPQPAEDLSRLARRDGLYDDDLRVRSYAARLLGRAGSDENIEPLVEFLGRSKHPSEMSAALSALEQINTKDAADAAIRALGAVPNEQQRLRWMKRFETISNRVRERELPGDGR